MKLSFQISFRLDERHGRALEAAAERQGMSVHELARRYVEERLDNAELLDVRAKLDELAKAVRDGQRVGGMLGEAELSIKVDGLERAVLELRKYVAAVVNEL